jgi:hypothetical protein
MDKKQLKFIKAIEDLRTIILKSTKQDEVDFLLEILHEKGEAIRKKVEDGAIYKQDNTR